MQHNNRKCRSSYLPSLVLQLSPVKTDFLLSLPLQVQQYKLHIPPHQETINMLITICAISQSSILCGYGQNTKSCWYCPWVSPHLLELWVFAFFWIFETGKPALLHPAKGTFLFASHAHLVSQQRRSPSAPPTALTKNCTSMSAQIATRSFSSALQEHSIKLQFMKEKDKLHPCQ